MNSRTVIYFHCILKIFYGPFIEQVQLFIEQLHADVEGNLFVRFPATPQGIEYLQYTTVSSAFSLNYSSDL